MQPSEITCPACGLRMRLPANFVGRAAKCPQCRGVVPVPEVLSLDDDPPAPQNAFAFDDRPAAPTRSGYRKAAEQPDGPQWLMGVAALPVALAFYGGAVGGACGGLAMGLNIAVARRKGWPLGGRLAAMGAISAASVAVYFAVASFILNKMDDRVEAPRPAERREEAPPRRADDPPRRTERPRESSAPVPVRVGDAGRMPDGWDATVRNYARSPQLAAGSVPAKFADQPVHHLVGHGLAKLPDGPAAATAAYYHGDNTLVVGYADGATAVWRLDKPLDTPPSPGPKFDGKVERVWIVGRSRYVVAEVGGAVHVATAGPPYKGVRTPPGLVGVRVCAFGTAAVVRKTASGFEARWLLNDTPENETPLPPKQFAEDFCRWGEKLENPPADPQALVWLHTNAAAVLPDGRVTVWNHQGKALTVEAHPRPVTAWAAGPNQVVLTSLDAGGNVQVRREPDFTVHRRVSAGGRKLVRVLSNDSGDWTMGTDAAGGVVMWRSDGKSEQVLFDGVKGTAAEPVVPLAVVWPNTFVVGRGRAVELWSPDVLAREKRK